MDTQIFQLKDFIPLISTLVSGFISYKITKITIFPKTNAYILKKQLYNLYLPLFKLISKNIFKKRRFVEIEPLLTSIDATIEQHYELVDPSLIAHINSCHIFLDEVKKGKIIANPDTKDEFNNEERMLYYFKKAEILISKKFDEIRAQLGLPTRSFYFKFSNNQLTPIWSNAIDTLLTYLTFIILFFMMAFIILFTIDMIFSAYTKVATFIIWLFN